MPHRIVGAVVATMESKLPGRVAGRIKICQPYFLSLHLDDVFEVSLDLSGIERSNSDHNFDAICHGTFK